MNEFTNSQISLSPSNNHFILNAPCLIFNMSDSFPNYLLNGLSKDNISMSCVCWSDENLIFGGLEDFSIGIYYFEQK
jgi:hypothetical protein